jgi:FAD/FMN-containing dehydrogenase
MCAIDARMRPKCSGNAPSGPEIIESARDRPRLGPVIGRRSFLRSAGGALAAGAALGGSAASRAFADCAGATVGDGAISRFRSRISGQVILPADLPYGSARLVYNRRFDPYPVAIVRAASESDVARTIEFARTNGIRLAVRSGGHSYIGASGGDGIVLDMGAMSGIAPLGGANFRIGTGARLHRVYSELHCTSGMTLPCGSCDTVGFGGIAQGGGFGYLQREHGLTCDRVRAVRVVLADGTVTDASPDGDDDLFWALRGGGGGSFGVATHFDVEAVPFATIRVVGWYWPLAAADEVLAHFHAVAASGDLPPNATAALVFNRPSAAMRTPQCLGLVFCTGGAAAAEAAASLFHGRGGVRRTPGLGFAYDAETPACDPAEVTEASRYRAKSSMVFAAPAADTGSVLRERLLARVQDERVSASDYASVNFLTFGGAAGALAPDATAFRHREAVLEVQYLAYVGSPGSEANAANDAWIRSTFAEVSPRLSLGGRGGYVNYADEDLPESEWPAYYWGGNYARLQATKRRVDPHDVFRGRQTVRP